MNTLAVGAIFKNEAPYIVDWLAWHRALGASRFVIADNDSTDGTTEILSALHKRRIITHVPFAGRLHANPQLEAYRYICKALRGISDWVALIDADEFICPTDSDDDLCRMLTALPAGVGGVAINWAIFGSSGQVAADAEPVFTRFVRRALQHTPIERVEASNRHYKSIIRPQAMAVGPHNPHFFKLKAPWNYARIDAQPLIHEQPPMFGLSYDVNWANFRINHYVIKSSAEFFHKKLARGLADQHGFTRHHSFFRRHDFNDVEDRPAQWLLERFFERRASLLALLGSDAELVEKAGNELLKLAPLPPSSNASDNGAAEPPMNAAIPSVRMAPKWRRKLRNHRLSINAGLNRHLKIREATW
ncbi:MAG: glycosyltransferase family 2 protein [Steroidobacteraceae bacterium]